MSSKFKVNKEDRNPIEIQADITADSKIQTIEWHLAEKIYNNLKGILVYRIGIMPKFELLETNFRKKFLNLAKEILGEEKLNDDTRQN